jgi:dephospho-CoA kinase
MSKTKHCFTIGLTGGIASGKSAVSHIFNQLGCEIIDTDIEARIAVEPGSNGLSQLIDTFGESILTKEDSLDRTKLRKIVFNDDKQLTLINAILHPIIEQSVINKIKQMTSNYCIIVIPLLCESSSYDWLDRVLVVDVKAETQLKRLLARDNIDKALADKMMASQCSREKRLAIADDVINNEHSLQDLTQRVELLNRLYKTF